MSYGKELMLEQEIDAEIFYTEVCDKIKILEQEKEARKQGEHLNMIWTTKAGQKIPFAEMTDQHLDNIIHCFHKLID